MKKMTIRKGYDFIFKLKNLIRLINQGFKKIGLALLTYYETQFQG